MQFRQSNWFPFTSAPIFNIIHRVVSAWVNYNVGYIPNGGFCLKESILRMLWHSHRMDRGGKPWKVIWQTFCLSHLGRPIRFASASQDSWAWGSLSLPRATLATHHCPVASRKHHCVTPSQSYSGVKQNNSIPLRKAFSVIVMFFF